MHVCAECVTVCVCVCRGQGKCGLGEVLGSPRE